MTVTLIVILIVIVIVSEFTHLLTQSHLLLV